MKHGIEIIPARPATPHPDTIDLLVRLTPHEVSEKAPVDMALVVDTSGSMSGLPLQLARHAITQLIPHFAPSDRVALVTFANGPAMQMPLLSIKENSLTLERRLTQLRATGSTALHAGWQLGAGLLVGARHNTRLSSVLLLTDGRPNVGETRPAFLAGDLRHMLRQGISTSVVGTGLRYNETLLERLADAGDGNFHHAERPDELVDLFATELRHLQSTVGRHARLRVQGMEVIDVLNDLPREGYDVLLPPLRAGQVLNLVLRVRVSGGQSAQFTVTWTNLKGETQRQEVRFLFPVAFDVQHSEHPEVVQHRSQLLAVRAQRELARHLDAGDVGQALDTLTLSRRHLLRAQAGGAHVDADLQELNELEQRVRRGERTAASKKARSSAYNKSTGRS